ncbi:MAG: tRNA (adenosine(37)-N6)-threonylcarbamoyltransferase complex dimerization subunit type 1 TsaB [Terriglobia bacterium]
MIILSIDTSSMAGSIVLSGDEGFLGEHSLESSQTHSVRLLAAIDLVLRGAERSISDVEGFAVISGPGSFTGLRIGLTTVKGIAEVLRRPVIPITASEAWAEKHSDLQGILIPLVPAGRKEVFATIYERHGAQLTLHSEGIVGEMTQVVTSILPEKAHFIGPAVLAHREFLEGLGKQGWKFHATDPFLAPAMARIAHRRARQKDFFSAGELAAFYLRPSDAEINWKEKSWS